LSTAQINAMDDSDMVAWGSQQIQALATSAVANLTSNQIGNLNRPGYRGGQLV